MSVTLDCTSAPFVRCGKKLSYGGGESRSKKCKRGYGGAYGEVWRRMNLAGVCWRSCVCAFGRSLASVALKMFSHVIYFVKKCYKCCTLNAICKDNAAINCVNVQQNKGPFPSTLTGHTTLVLTYMQRSPK
jgi:hypothetical protein